MNLERLVAVSGKPGIYRMVSNNPNGLIVEDLDNKKRFFISGHRHQFTPLESISIYTETEEGTTELKKVFRSMLEQVETNPPSLAKGTDMRAYFAEVLPTFDRARVLISDIKKIIKWFLFLNERNLLSLEEETTTEETTEEA